MRTAEAIEESPKREAILEAALALFAERGFHGTAVPEIANRAKVGAGTVYRYFESKEALVNVLYREWKTRMSDATMKELPVGLAPRALFHEVFVRLIDFAAEHPLAMAFLEYHHHAEYLDKKSQAVDDAARKPMRELIVALQKARAMREGPPDVLIALLWGGLMGTLRQGPPDAKKSLFIEECLWEAVRR